MSITSFEFSALCIANSIVVQFNFQSSFFVNFEKVPVFSYNKDCPVMNSFGLISVAEFVFVMISYPSEIFLSNFLFYYIYPTPPLGQDMTQGQFFKRSLTGLNSEFSFS